MRKNPLHAAYLLIDMQKGFVDATSAHCIPTAAATIPACNATMALAREKGMPVVLIKRSYRADGSDVENTRYDGWVRGGRSMSPGSESEAMAEGLLTEAGDYTVIKPRWSAFFGTELDLILRRLDVHTVILAGTTTPNCIRTTCYDAIALDYNVVALSDCCSSVDDLTQQVNMADMARVGARVITAAEFAHYEEFAPEDLAARIRAEMLP
jgi:nicotinamidase-related amidase